jgi:hypothetical protein
MLYSYFLKGNTALLTDGAQLPPLPWTSFTSHAVVVDSLSSTWYMVKPLLGDVVELSLGFSYSESKCNSICAFRWK